MKKVCCCLLLLCTRCVFICQDISYCVEDYFFKHPEKFETQEDVFQWMSEHYNHAPNNDWLMPEETYKVLQGDCEDWTTLAMYFLNEIGIKTSMAAIYITITDSYHTLIRINNDFFESTGVNQNLRFEEGIFIYEYEMSYCEAIGKSIYK